MIYIVKIKQNIDIYLLDSVLKELKYEDIGRIKSIKFFKNTTRDIIIKIDINNKTYVCDNGAFYDNMIRTKLFEVTKILKEKLT